MQHRAPAAQSIRGAKGLIAVAISFTDTKFSRSPWPARRLKLINGRYSKTGLLEFVLDSLSVFYARFYV